MTFNPKKIAGKAVRYFKYLLFPFLVYPCRDFAGRTPVLNAALSEPLPERSEHDRFRAPRVWQEKLHPGGGLDIVIDAEISVPTADRFPVAAMRADRFTQQQADRIMKVLLAERTLCEIKREITWEDLREQMHDIRDYMVRPGSGYHRMEQENPALFEAVRARLMSRIGELRSRMNEVADIYVPGPASRTFQSGRDKMLACCASPERLKRLPDMGIIEGEAALGKRRPALLSILSSDSPMENYVRFVNTDMGDAVLTGLREPAACLDGGRDRAVRTARALVGELGLDDMELAAAGTAELVGVGSAGPDPAPVGSRGCHVLFFTRSVAGVPMTYVSDYEGAGAAGSESCGEPWFDEMLRICVDDAGITALDWRCPVRVTDILREDAGLLPFEDIMTAFRRHIAANGVWDGDPAILGRRIFITRITLGMAKAAKDRAQSCLLVPAWNFFGCVTYRYGRGGSDAEGEDEQAENEFAHSFLTLSAIDGSVISRPMH